MNEFKSLQLSAGNPLFFYCARVSDIHLVSVENQRKPVWAVTCCDEQQLPAALTEFSTLAMTHLPAQVLGRGLIIVRFVGGSPRFDRQRNFKLSKSLTSRTEPIIKSTTFQMNASRVSVYESC